MKLCLCWREDVVDHMEFRIPFWIPASVCPFFWRCQTNNLEKGFSSRLSREYVRFGLISGFSTVAAHGIFLLETSAHISICWNSNVSFCPKISIMSNIGASGRAAGGELEEKIDLTPETDAKLEQSAALAKSGQVREALAILAALEKRCRVGNDPQNLVRVCEASLQYCKDAGDDELLLTTLQTLTTKRSQKTQAVSALVHKAMPWCVLDQYTPISVSSAEEKTARDNLVEALRGIADGKLFLEGELARLTRALSIIKVRSIHQDNCNFCILW